jgi:hypothetical protein
MRLFNLDMHISIVHDIKHIFQNLNHTVESVNLSGHTWVNGEKQGKIKVVNARNWKTIDQDMCDRFYRKYKNKLNHYDGFVHSYPPAFALLFEKFEKPIITIACTRFDYPVQADRLNWLVNGLQRLHRNGQLIPIANNLLDKHYCDDWFGFEWRHISSLCDYMETKYRPEKNKFITWQRVEDKPIRSELVDYSFSIKEQYDRSEISKYLGVVHIPYNLSIMSAFEHYIQAIPLFFPSQKFQEILFRDSQNMLGEILFPNSPLTFSPNLIKLADWYDSSNMRHVSFFESFDHLSELLHSSKLGDISESMSMHNKIRKVNVYSKWREVLEEIK